MRCEQCGPVGDKEVNSRGGFMHLRLVLQVHEFGLKGKLVLAQRDADSLRIWSRARGPKTQAGRQRRCCALNDAQQRQCGAHGHGGLRAPLVLSWVFDHSDSANSIDSRLHIHTVTGVPVT